MEDVRTMSMLAVGRKYGVSDNAVRRSDLIRNSDSIHYLDFRVMELVAAEPCWGREIRQRAGRPDTIRALN